MLCLKQQLCLSSSLHYSTMLQISGEDLVHLYVPPFSDRPQSRTSRITIPIANRTAALIFHFIFIFVMDMTRIPLPMVNMYVRISGNQGSGELDSLVRKVPVDLKPLDLGVKRELVEHAFCDGLFVCGYELHRVV